MHETVAWTRNVNLFHSELSLLSNMFVHTRGSGASTVAPVRYPTRRSVFYDWCYVVGKSSIRSKVSHSHTYLPQHVPRTPIRLDQPKVQPPIKLLYSARPPVLTSGADTPSCLSSSKAKYTDTKNKSWEGNTCDSGITFVLMGLAVRYSQYSSGITLSSSAQAMLPNSLTLEPCLCNHVSGNNQGDENQSILT